MSSQKTTKLGLHKWVPTDYVKREEFNDNFAKIDEHAVEVTQQLAQTEQEIKSELAQLPTQAEVRLKSDLIGLNDASTDLLAAIEGGEGTSFNLLSIPKNKSVTPTSTTFIDTSNTNLFNKSTAEVSKSIYTTGEVVADVNYILSDYIPVNPNTPYTAKSMGSRAFYDINKTYISGESWSVGNTTTIPNNAFFIRFAFDKQQATIENQIFVEGTTLPSEYIPYTEKPIIAFSQGVQFEVSSRLKGKKWNALGDSITNGLQVTSYHQQIASKTGCIVRNYGISSSTIADYGAWETNPMVLRYQNMDNDADIITVFGGVNDAGSGVPMGTIDSTDIKTFYGAYNVLLSGLITKYPTKLIATFTPLQQTDSPRNTKQMVQAVKEVSAKYGIPCLDLYSMSGINSVNIDHMTLDKLHPNTLGHSVIAGKILTFLENNLPITA